MNVVDSSGWLEYFSEGSNADFFAPAIETVEELLIPVISIYEVFKRICQQRDEGVALQAVASMKQGRIIELDAPLALNAAKISIDLKIPMADSIILATARLYQAVLWTQDEDFKGINGVKYKRKSS